MVLTIRMLDNPEARSRTRNHCLVRRAVLHQSVGAVLLLFAASRLRRLNPSLPRTTPHVFVFKVLAVQKWMESCVGGESRDELIDEVGKRLRDQQFRRCEVLTRVYALIEAVQPWSMQCVGYYALPCRVV